VVRVHVPAGRAVELEPLGGLVISVPQSSYQVTDSNGAVEPKVQRDMPALMGLVLGFDTRVGTDRFAIVPSLRIRVTSGNPADFSPKGFPRWTITPGVGARIGFDQERRSSTSSEKPTYLIGLMGVSDRSAYTKHNGSPDYLTGPTGRTAAMSVGGGIFLHRSVALDIWFSRGGVMTSRQGIRYGRHKNVELRDNFLTAGARFRIPLSRSVAVEPVGAFLLTFHEAVSQEECCDFAPYQTLTIYPRMTDALPISPGMAIGVDVPIGRGRVALVPTLRLFFTSNNLSNYYDPEYTQLTWVPGLGVRFAF
jgi:hypothetical protein